MPYTTIMRIRSAVVIIAVLVSLVCVVGLVIDSALIFVRYSKLQQAVDSAAVATAIERARGQTELDQIARQLLADVYELPVPDVTITTCATRRDNFFAPVDEELCNAGYRDPIRVTARVTTPVVFLQLFGWPEVIVRASAIADTPENQ